KCARNTDSYTTNGQALSASIGQHRIHCTQVRLKCGCRRTSPQRLCGAAGEDAPTAIHECDCCLIPPNLYPYRDAPVCAHALAPASLTFQYLTRTFVLLSAVYSNRYENNQTVYINEV